MTRSFIFSSFLLISSALALSGCVNAAIGIGTAAVAASTTEKGLSTSVSDSVIQAKLSESFIQTSQSIFLNVETSVNDGSVLLTGKLKTQEEKITATRLSWEIRGVREVINEIQLSDASSFKSSAKDLAASAQLRAALIRDANISSLNFSVDVVNGIVYLSGVAKNEEERERVVAHAQELRFAKQVVSYIILIYDRRK
ncbi:MAG: BON domain-containing protein [Alphaproteobacteria bacterium]|jgi:osmotically-inducible protein OsmY|nr:BON domain-containing protein [Alphaproteobacteria bacterium]